jgi:beta-lactamase regulating signal transducer with metallopeptidase domain
MNWFESHIAPAVVQFGANWLVQSTLLISAAMFAASMVRRAALQSAIYRGALLAVAAVPAASLALAAMGLGAWSLPLPTRIQATNGAPRVVSGADANHALPTIPALNTTPSASFASGPDSREVVGGPNAPTAVTQRESVPGIAIERSWPSLLSVLSIGWLAGSAFLLLRLAVACRGAQRLLATAGPANPEVVALCRELSSRVGVAAPAVRQSPYVASPCLVGCRQPVILLPADQPDETLRDVLIHELAHAKRRDGHWLLAERMLSAVLCFQPLLRLLARRLEASAEAVCDDQVLACGGEAIGYARGLADLAERNTTPITMVAVGLFAQRSMLQHRVVRIMNAQRTLSTHAGIWPLTAVLLMTTGLTVAAGAIGAAPTPQASAEQPKPEQATAVAENHTIVGQISGPDGQPLAGVHVAATASSSAPERGGDLGPRGEVLAEAVTDAQGRYRLEHHASSQTHREAMFIARGPETALAWKPLDLDAKQAEISLALEPGETLVAQLVDQAGRPAAGVQANLVAIVQRVEGKQFPEQKVSAWWMKSLPQAWPSPQVSDAEGRIALNGLPAGHGAYVNIDGTDRFAPQSIALNTGMPTERGERDGTYRSQVVNAAAGAEPVAQLEPAQVITGRVTYADTGLPAPHARLTISCSQQKFGSMMSVPGKADAEGRYRISVMPGVQFGVTAYPPDGMPYLGREGERFDWQPGDTTREFDITLPRGVVVQGRVMAGETPVAGASVLYLPNQDTSRGKSNVLTGWQAIELTGADGRYHIVVLPGVGRLLVNAPSDDFVPKEVGGREIWEGQPGGERIQAHAIERIDAQEGSPPIALDVQLKPAGHVAGQLVDREGARIDQALLFSSLLFDRHGGNWRGFPQELVGGHFQLGGVPTDGKATVYFLEPKRKLGTTVSLAPGDNRPVALEPCGEVTMRFVDAAGQPIPKHFALVEFVVTPGASRFDQAAAKAGQLSADAMIIDNMDLPTFRDLATDEDGRLTLPALIPGANYRVSTFHDGTYHIVKDFTARSGEKLDLGDLTVERNKEE